MARIRTIKPEFPQSESMGNVTRDARLCFIMLWTIADDSGRLRGASRMLASLLFPYDNDAPKLMAKWLAELEREHCIRRYQVDGAQYVEIAKWLDHQKIDRPSPSKIPAFDEGSRIVSNDREGSSLDLDQGPRTKEGKGEDREDAAEVALADWQSLCEEHDLAKVAKLTSKRRASLNARLEDCGGLDGWRSALAKIRGSPFMLGKNDRGWKVDFDFLVSESGFTKLMEGKYDGGSGVQRGKKSGGATGWAAVLLEQAGETGFGGLGSGGERVDPANDGSRQAGAAGSGTIIEASYTRSDEAVADIAGAADRRSNVGR